MSPDNPFDGGKPGPLATVLDTLRARIDAERFDSIVFWLEAVAADLGYGDVRPLPGAVAWIEEMRGAGKRTALAASGNRRLLVGRRPSRPPGGRPHRDRRRPRPRLARRAA